MQTQFREMPEADRRRHQEELGLVIITRRPEPPPPEKRKRMHEPQTQNRTNSGSQAQTTIDKMARAMTEPPTFKAVAMHELQRAAVYVPILFSTGVGLVWTCRKLFFKTP